MSRKSVTINLKTLSKVCKSRNSLDYILKNLSTAAERSYFKNPNGFDGEICVEYHQQDPNGCYNNNNVEFKHNSRGNLGEILQNPDGNFRGNLWRYCWGPSGYPREIIGEFMHNPSVGQTNDGPHQIPEVYQKGMGDLQVTRNSTTDNEFVGPADGNQLIGSVEELDGFCKEGKLKEAVEVLGLLEQNRIPVDIYASIFKADEGVWGS